MPISTEIGELNKIVDSTPVLLVRCSRDLRYRYISKACADLLGRTQEEIIGRRIIDIVGPRGLETIRPFVDAVLAGQRVEYERVVDYLKAGPRHLHVVYIPEFDEDGQVGGWIASIADITERVEAEARRLESERRFLIMANSVPVLLWMSRRDSLRDFFNAGWLAFTALVVVDHRREVAKRPNSSPVSCEPMARAVSMNRLDSSGSSYPTNLDGQWQFGDRHSLWLVSARRR